MDLTRLKQLFTEEDAVSPVIGVILMVAITVILAAVIGTFVLGLGENVQDSAPQANFQFSYSGDFAGTEDSGTVTITHTGGEDVSRANLEVQVGGETALDGDTVGSWADSTRSDISGWGATISTGSSAALEQDGTGDDEGDTVRVIWTSPSGGTSNTIGQSTVPS